MPLHPLSGRCGRRLVAAAHRHHPAVVRVSGAAADLLFERRISAAHRGARFAARSRLSVRRCGLRGGAGVSRPRHSACASIWTGWTRSLAAIRMRAPLSHAEWAESADDLVARNGGGDQYLYMQVTRGAEFGRNHAWPDGLKPTLFAFATALEPVAPRLLEQGVAAVTAADMRWARRDIKTTALLANVLLKKLAADAGAYETILLENGELTEGSSTTVHIVKDGVILHAAERPSDSARHDARCGHANSPRDWRSPVDRARRTGGGVAHRRRDLARLFDPRRIAGHSLDGRAGRQRPARSAVPAHARRVRRLHSRTRRDADAMSGTHAPGISERISHQGHGPPRQRRRAL